MLRHERPVEALARDRAQERRQASRYQLKEMNRRFPQESSSNLKPTNVDQVESDDAEELEEHWRQAAQMLTDDGEYLLDDRGKSRQQRNRQRQPQEGQKYQAYTTKQQSPGYAQNAPSTPESAQSRDTNSADNEADDDEQFEDDDSSISFAQSGCQSILSAWRIKAANRAARQLSRNSGRDSHRPTSVLSNGSSAITKKSLASTTFTSRGKSPASQTRIPLGPAQAQHFVTNSRRRRRANELILETLEARRRTLALSRQNTASLFGSASYLDGLGLDPMTGGVATGGQLALIQASSDDYNPRLSLSPSPLGRRGASPTALLRKQHQQQPRGPMSDIGQSRNSSTNNKLALAASSTASQAQRQRLLTGVKRSKESLKSINSKSPPAAPRRPPLAKLDQNSSDLYSSNSSSSDSSESSGSHFTQLVSSELAPDCILLDEQALKQSQQRNLLIAPQTSISQPRESFKRPARVLTEKPATSARPASTTVAQPPKVPERTKRKLKLSSSSPSPKPVTVLERKSESEVEGASKLRRGALRRDSIRRLRLNRTPQQQQQQQQQASMDSSSDVAQSSSDSSSFEVRKQQPLSPSRKLDIESNPFLNRGHFRTTSVRTTNNEAAPNLSEPTSTPKRNSWLFGSTRSGKQNDEAAVITTNNPRMFSEARRSSSSEQLAANRANKQQQKLKQQQQQQQQQEEDIRQVERMLRQMKPNQVFTSYAEEKQTSTMRDTVQNAPNMAASVKSSKLPANTTSNVKPNNTSAGNFATSTETTRATESPTRLVKKGSKSHNDLKFDATGNRRHYELEERWKHEKTSTGPVKGSKSPRDSEQRSEEKMISQRIEIMRSSSISPPVEFADPKSTFSPPRTSYQSMQQQQQQQQHQQTRRQPQPTAGLVTTTTASLQPANMRVQSSRELTQQAATRSKSPTLQQQKQVEREQQVAPSSVYRRALSEERPPVVARRKVPTTSTQPDQPRPIRNQQQVLKANKLQAEPSLPKFERTADDEFKKRVDYLRKLARANLTDEPVVSQQKVAGKALTKPMSTNWRQSNQQQEKSQQAKSNRWSFEPSPAERAKMSEQERRVAMTNLDALLADQYQLPVNEQTGSSAFQWRRSNSSLASLPTTRLARPTAEPARASLRSQASTNSERQESQSNNYSQAPSNKQLTSSAVVKLVVKEKSAPKLDYAIVEQHQPKGANQQQVEFHQVKSQQPVGSLVSKQAPQVNTSSARSPLRVASPRSPEFGAMAASSNDDSAIASSVSSPSLSFMMNPPNSGNEQTKPAPGTTTNQSASPNQSKPLTTLRVRPVNLASSQPVADQSSAATTGALQSILRRHQQQQQHSSPDTSSDSSSPRQQQVSESLEPNVKRVHNEQPQEPLFRSDARSPEPATSRPMSPSLKSSQPSQADSQTQEQQQAATKRVHFNDRTSIRSFESISSLASNSTAVPNDVLRQQVGSPDSMGSGSTSRLSAESPDLRKTSGAAIYAVRGDPELELDHANNLMALHHQQIVQQQQPIHYVPRYPEHLKPAGVAMMQAQPQAQPALPYLSMTAPPSISTAGASPQCSPQQVSGPAQVQQHIQYIVRPTSLTSTQIVPTRNFVRPPQAAPIVPKQNVVLDDDDDAYAFRLRQAATSRVFNYATGAPASPIIAQVQQQPTMQLQQQQQIHPAAIGVHHLQAGQSTSQTSRQQQTGNKKQQSRRHLDDLLNFHTEV